MISAPGKFMQRISLMMLTIFLLSSACVDAAGRNDPALTIIPGGNGTKGKDDGTVRAEAVLAGINTSEQLKPRALELLDRLKISHPGRRTYTIVISDDARMLKIGNYLAVATARDGKTTVTGGIPTAMDIRVMRASRIEVRKPDKRSIQVAYDVAMMKKDAPQQGKLQDTTAIYARVAKKYRLKAVQVKQIENEITQYYNAFKGNPF